MHALLRPTFYRPVLLVAAWCFVMWLVSRYFGLPGIEIKTTYGTLLWLGLTYAGVALILYRCRPRA